MRQSARKLLCALLLIVVVNSVDSDTSFLFFFYSLFYLTAKARGADFPSCISNRFLYNDVMLQKHNATEATKQPVSERVVGFCFYHKYVRRIVQPHIFCIYYFLRKIV